MSSTSSTLSTPPSSNLRSRTRGAPSTPTAASTRPDSVHSTTTFQAPPPSSPSSSSRTDTKPRFKPTNPHGGPARGPLFRFDPRYIAWRLNMWAQATMAGGMLETWEKALLATFIILISLLVWYSAFHYLPTHTSIMIRRAYYYLFGSSAGAPPVVGGGGGANGGAAVQQAAEAALEGATEAARGAVKGFADSARQGAKEVGSKVGQ